MPIGYSARLTQNNGPSGLYQNEVNHGAGQIHIALMGDPTLRMHVVAPPTNLAATTNNGSVTLNWTASSDSVVGYHVYRTGADGSFSRLTTTPISATTFADAAASGAANYMVRAVKLETSGSGTYLQRQRGRVYGLLSGSAGGVTSGGTDEWRDQQPCLRAEQTAEALPPAEQHRHQLDYRHLDQHGCVGGRHLASRSGQRGRWRRFLELGQQQSCPLSGSVASQSSLGAGLHEHFFSWASQTLSVNTGEVFTLMFTWIRQPAERGRCFSGTTVPGSIAPTGVPTTLASDLRHTGRVSMGALPAAGQWALLQVPASQVGLEGSTVHGLAFSQFDGRATWDNAGKASALLVNNPTSTNNPPPTSGGTNTVPTGGTNGGGTTAGGGSTNSTGGTLTNTVAWVDDALPAGAVQRGRWRRFLELGQQQSCSCLRKSRQSIQHRLRPAPALSSPGPAQTLSVNTGDTLFATSISIPPIRPARSCCSGMTIPGSIALTGAPTISTTGLGYSTAAFTWARCRRPANGLARRCLPARWPWKAAPVTAWPSATLTAAPPGITPAKPRPRS